MRFGLLSLILAGVFVCVFDNTVVVEAQNAYQVHTVQPGETLSSIASRYGVSVQQLANYNGIRNTAYIRVGQPLRIPQASRPAEPAPASTADGTGYRADCVYTVYRGDSLYAVASYFGVSVEAIIARNNLRSSAIYVGQRLIIPGEPQPETPDPAKGSSINYDESVAILPVVGN